MPFRLSSFDRQRSQMPPPGLRYLPKASIAKQICNCRTARRTLDIQAWHDLNQLHSPLVRAVRVSAVNLRGLG
jgi:hypothetical protein